MLELVQRQSTPAGDHRRIIATAHVGDTSPEDVPRGEGSSSCAARGGPRQRRLCHIFPSPGTVAEGLSWPLAGFQ
jgi:hypothetical protein